MADQVTRRQHGTIAGSLWMAPHYCVLRQFPILVPKSAHLSRTPRAVHLVATAIIDLSRSGEDANCMLDDLCKGDRDLLDAATALRNRGEYDKASELLMQRVVRGIDKSQQGRLALVAEAAGLLIDVGAEDHIERAIKQGLSLIEDNREGLDGFITTASLEYNLGNAKRALSDICRRHALDAIATR